MSKQILFRLDENTATQLEKKLSDKGITKQFLFNKVVELFLDDKLSLDSNMITNNSPQITIDSNEVAETIKKQYLNDLAKMIAKDNNLIALVTKKLSSNFINELESFDSNLIANDIENPILVETETAELEEIETEKIINPKIKNKSLVSDSPLVQEKVGINNKNTDNQTTHGGDNGNDTSKEKTFDDTIAKIKALYSEGKTNGKIVKILNNDGYPTKKGSRKKWKTNQVQTILKRIK